MGLEKNAFLIFYIFFEILNFIFFSFLSVFLVPELYRKLRETRGINFHQVSSIYVLVVSSYDQKTKSLKFSILIFRQWLKELGISDVRIGFHVSNCVFSQLEMSIGLNFTSIIKHLFFKKKLFFTCSWGYK